MKQCNKPAATAIATLIIAAVSSIAWNAAAKTTVAGQFHHVEVTTKVSGNDVVATIRVTGRGGYGCNTLYPWRLTVTPGQGVEMPKTSFGKGDAKQFTRDAVVFVVGYSTAPGTAKIEAKLRLSVCNEKQCQMEQVDLSWPAS